MSESFVYKIINNETGKQEGAYNRSYHTEYEFSSVSDARRSNVHDIFQDKRKYKIQKWKVTYELVDDDADPYRQAEIPYYKEYLERKAFIDAMNESTSNAFKEAFKQFNIAMGLTPAVIKDIVRKEEEKKKEEIEDMNKNYKGTTLAELTEKLKQHNNSMCKLPKNLRNGWK